MSCGHREDVGAYVLGALSDDEHGAFVAHLAGCRDCRAEVDELQMVADTLTLTAVPMAPPPELKDRIMAVVRAEAELLEASGAAADVPAAEPARAPRAEPEPEREPSAPPRPDRRRRRERGWWRASLSLRPFPVAVAATLLIALGVGGGVLLSGGEEAGRAVPATVVLPSAPSARASLIVGGDRATLQVRGFPPPPRGRVYQVWLKRPGRPPAPTNALFSVRDGNATVPVPGSVRGVEQVLVTAEPDGGSRAPTRDPIIIAQPA
jgi:anti-sigma factor RsiW